MKMCLAKWALPRPRLRKLLLARRLSGLGSRANIFGWPEMFDILSRKLINLCRITMASPPHLLCHFGMAGWFHIKGIPTFYYKDVKKDKKADKEWPPQHWKFSFQTKPEGNDKAVLDAAFVDFRRFSRVRLMNCAIENIRNISPLVDNGPDPNTDKDIVTRDWLAALCQKKKVPIKALLLNQANISGVGNWVGDEILFQARMHPEQYANTLSDDQITELYKQLMTVVDIAIETKSDSDKFPETWLFKHRWGKGRKAVYQMPNGDKITYLTVGGRTSAIVPSLQKKTGAVAGDLDANESKASGTNVTKSKGKRKQIDEDDEPENEPKTEEEPTEETTTKPTKRTKKPITNIPPTATAEELATEEPKPRRSRRSTGKQEEEEEEQPDATQAPQNKRLKIGGALAPEEKAPAGRASNSPSTRRSRKSNPRLPPTQTAEETQQVLDESNAKHVKGRTSTAAKDAAGAAKKIAGVKKEMNDGGKQTDESLGRRRSGRISGMV